MSRDFERCLAAMIERDDLLAERLIRLDGMTVALDSEIPLVWDANYVRIERPGLDVETAVAAADEWIGGAGMSHRVVAAPDRADGERLAKELVPRGWEIERDVYMLHRRAAEKRGDAEVEEVRQDAIAEVRRGFTRDDLEQSHGPDYATPEIVEQLLVWDRKIGELCGDRWFVARHEGEIASACRLLTHGGIGQVESVNTFPAARGLGLASSVVLAALEASTAAGNDSTFLCADADDWPKQLYARLGFDAIGEDSSLYLKPQRAA